jgi:hypothetical protein
LHLKKTQSAEVSVSKTLYKWALSKRSPFGPSKDEKLIFEHQILKNKSQPDLFFSGEIDERESISEEVKSPNSRGGVFTKRISITKMLNSPKTPHQFDFQFD